MPLYATPPAPVEQKAKLAFSEKNLFGDYVLISKGGSKKMLNSNVPQSEPRLECTFESLARDNVPIRSFKIPTDWKQTKRNSKWAYGGQAGYDYEFAPSQSAQTLTIFINWDGTIIQESERAFWRDIFVQPAHDLSASELEFLFKTVQLNFASPQAFKLTTAKTVNWNGKKVIQYEGDSVKGEEADRRLYAIVFDNYPQHNSAGVIGFSGSKEEFEQKRKAVIDAIKSVQWK